MKKNIILGLFVTVLCLSVSVGAALAYFSDYEEASGGAVLTLGGQTRLYEGNDNTKKEIRIENTGETDMITRVAIFGQEEYMKPITFEKASDWEKIGDFYYYTKVLKPGETTSQITAEMSFDWKTDDPDKKPDYQFDITVVHESTQAVYDGKQLAKPKGWDYVPTVSE
ncbi:MAG: hypothetical protein E7220_00245 [Clostridiales bacterium]|nr:hypothetical protein [Clostridiales bacterium]